MARIRTIKPEAFISESLAEVSVEAERTFFGLLTQADDYGRHRDNAAIIAGLLWPLRAEHTSVHVEDDLTQLAQAGLVCRYTGCDGRRYLHIVTWHEHQKIDKPSQSRMPACPQHHVQQRCGSCKGICARQPEAAPKAPRILDEDSARVSRPAAEPAQPATGGTPPRRTPPPPRQEQPGVRGTPTPPADESTPAQGRFAEGSPRTPRGFGEPSAPGSRILDPGSSVPTGREAPGEPPVSANRLLGEYVAACEQRPPGDVIGHLGRVVKKLLAEGIPEVHVRAGLRRFAEIQGHPSRLPSLVNDAMNAPVGAAAGSGGPGSRPAGSAHAGWTNPADPAAAYAEEL